MVQCAAMGKTACAARWHSLPESGTVARSPNQKAPRMTDRIALWLGLFIVAAIGLDIVANDAQGLVFLARELMKLIESLRFWD